MTFETFPSAISTALRLFNVSFSQRSLIVRENKQRSETKELKGVKALVRVYICCCKKIKSFDLVLDLFTSLIAETKAGHQLLVGLLRKQEISSLELDGCEDGGRNEI